MIGVIQGFIEDNTNVDVTRTQVIMALVVIVGIVALIGMMLYQGSSRPHVEDGTVKVSAPDQNAPRHIMGQ